MLAHSAESHLRREQALSIQALGETRTIGCLYEILPGDIAIKVGNAYFPSHALVDCGSNVCMIGHEQAQSHGGQNIYPDMSETMSSCGSIEKVIGLTNLTILIGHNKTPMDVTEMKSVVVPALVTPSPVHAGRILIGSNMLRALSFQIQEHPVRGTATLSYSVACPGEHADSPPAWRVHSLELKREGGECNTP